MEILQQYRKPDGSLTTNQVYIKHNGKETNTQRYTEDGTPMYEPKYIDAVDEKGNSLMLVVDISDEEFYKFSKWGHKASPTDFDEFSCFEKGIIEAIKFGIKNQEVNDLLDNPEGEEDA